MQYGVWIDLQVDDDYHFWSKGDDGEPLLFSEFDDALDYARWLRDREDAFPKAGTTGKSLIVVKEFNWHVCDKVKSYRLSFAGSGGIYDELEYIAQSESGDWNIYEIGRCVVEGVNYCPFCGVKL